MNALLDLFCGTGGFSSGFQSAAPSKFETRLGIDILPDALETFKACHTLFKELGDNLGAGDVQRLIGRLTCISWGALLKLLGALLVVCGLAFLLLPAALLLRLPVSKYTYKMVSTRMLFILPTA